MKNYIALIRRDDFTDLFKYGKIYIDKRKASELNIPISELPEHSEIFNEISQYNNSFDHGMAYTLIQYDKNEEEDFDIINIEEVKHIYPLDYESKKIFETTFDQRIRLENPLWPNVVEELQKIRAIDNCKKGISNLRSIVGIDEENSKLKIEEFIDDTLIKEFVEQLYSDRSPSGDLSIWTYLLRYNRHSHYPKNILGDFFDSINVVFNKWANQEVDESAFTSTEIYYLLESLNTPLFNLKLDSIYELIREKASKFLEKTDEFESRIDFLKVAVLFLQFRNLINDDFILDSTMEKYIKAAEQRYPEEYELAISLLGMLLGQEHTYDAFYSHLPLPIFRNPEIKIEKTESNVGESVFPSDLEEYVLEEESNMVSEPEHSPSEDEVESDFTEISHPSFPFEMGKITKQGTIAKTPKSRFVHNEKEYQEALGKGMKIIEKEQNTLPLID